jgi:hypothetical protein
MQNPLDTANQHPSPTTLPPKQANALTQLANAVLHDSVHLAVIAQDEPCVERAGQALQAWWQAMAPHVLIAHFQSQQTLTWIGCINQMVSSQGLELAMQAPATRTTPLEIGIIHEADQLTPADLKMLRDLTAHLPGLHMRWVLLFNTSPAAGAWPGTPVDAQHSPCAQWLTWHMDQQTTPNTPTHALWTAESQTATVAPPLVGQPKKWTDRAVILGLGALFLLGLLAWALRTEQETPPAIASPALPEPVLSTPAQADLSALPMAKVANDPMEPASAAPSNDPAKTPDPQTSATNAQASASVHVTENAITAKEAAPIVPDVALRGARWLAQISPDNFVLEHGRFQSIKLAQSVIRGRAELQNARILMVQTTAPNEPPFVLITGPFRSLGRAENYKIRENLPAQIPIVQVSRVLQERLPRPAP